MFKSETFLSKENKKKRFTFSQNTQSTNHHAHMDHSNHMDHGSMDHSKMNHGDHSNHAGHSMATYFYFGYNDVQMVLENWVIDSITSLLIACLILIIIVIFAEYLRLWRENFQLAMIQKIQSRPDSSLSSSNRDETDKMISSSTSKVSKSNQVSNSWRGGLSRVFRF